MASAQSPVDAIVEKAAAATPAPARSGLDLYSRFALAGALGCSITHGALTPVDVYVFPGGFWRRIATNS
jgi:solute carrier family 25 phosphate transporter 3